MSDSLKYAVFTLYAVLIIGMFVFALWIKHKRDSRIGQLQEDLKSKIEAGFDLTSKDIVIIGRAYDLSAKSSREALYRVYKGIKTPNEFEKLKTLVAEIDKDEPFDTMPDEVKPSLLRVSELSYKSGEESDKHILTPITNILTKYQELQEEQKKTRKQTNIAYMLTIISFIVGAISLYFAITAPTASDIATQLGAMKQ
ncbi:MULTISPECIES: hypothetical protein [Vibrio]|uniref:hypothetical protein n=1 Tax=Vibrio TaxID=662 RepID=UPI001CDD1F79|nr:hypothetical protein [Vibrio vulnificus]ELV8675416.1 hypothetical protein [Vibrio vulnificus]MCA3945245.1 hypothetical protein [Vibrio vulnificus]